MAFTHSTLKQQQETEREKSMVTLKQRTYRTKEGKAVGHGDPGAAFLVGPEGGRVSDETAVSLGLVNGQLPKNASPEELEGYEGRSKGEDRTGRRSAAQGRPVSVPAPKKDGEGKDKVEEKAGEKTAGKAEEKAEDKAVGKGEDKSKDKAPTK